MVTSNLPFGRWAETFSDDVVAAAMIDRMVHHAEVLTLTGDSYPANCWPRRTAPVATDSPRGVKIPTRGSKFRERYGVKVSEALTPSKTAKRWRSYVTGGDLVRSAQEGSVGAGLAVLPAGVGMSAAAAGAGWQAGTLQRRP